MRLCILSTVVVIFVELFLLVFAFLYGFFFEPFARIAAHVAVWISTVENVFFVISMWLHKILPRGHARTQFVVRIVSCQLHLPLYFSFIIKSSTTVTELIFFMRHNCSLKMAETTASYIFTIMELGVGFEPTCLSEQFCRLLLSTTQPS